MAGDGGAVDQIMRGDQHAIEHHHMLRRHEKIADRHILAERTGTEADRQKRIPMMLIDQAGQVSAIADPANRLRTFDGLNHIADLQIFHRNVTGRRQHTSPNQIATDISVGAGTDNGQRGLICRKG